MRKGLSTEDRIIQAASELFLEKGFNGTTVRDITKKAKVSVSALNYHFENKEKLFSEIITTIGKAHIEFAKRSLKTPKNQEELRSRLEIFLEELIVFQFENFAQTMLVQREVNFALPAMREALSVFTEMFNSLLTFFELAQKNKLISKNLPAEFLAKMILNTLAGEFRHLEVIKKTRGKNIEDASYRKDFLNNLINLTLEGAQTR